MTPAAAAPLAPQMEAQVSTAANALERLQAAFSFEDPDVTRLVVPGFLALLALLALAHAAVLLLFSLLPFHFRHYAWAAAMLCFYPAPHVSFAALEAVDATMRDYAPFPQQRLVAQGSGLEAARKELMRRQAGRKATPEEVRRAAQEKVRRRIEGEIRQLEASSNHKAAGATLARAPLGVVANLLARAPTLQRAQYVRAMRRLTKPGDQHG